MNDVEAELPMGKGDPVLEPVQGAFRQLEGQRRDQNVRSQVLEAFEVSRVADPLAEERAPCCVGAVPAEGFQRRAAASEAHDVCADETLGREVL